MAITLKNFTKINHPVCVAKCTVLIPEWHNFQVICTVMKTKNGGYFIALPSKKRGAKDKNGKDLYDKLCSFGTKKDGDWFQEQVLPLVMDALVDSELAEKQMKEIVDLATTPF